MVNPDIKGLMRGKSRRYSLVMATAKRAREIVEQANENGDIVIEKPVSIALKEIENGSLTYAEPKDEDNL